MTEYADVAVKMFNLRPELRDLLVHSLYVFDEAHDGNSDELYRLMDTVTDVDVVTDVAVVQTAQVLSTVHVYPDTWRAAWEQVKAMPATNNPELSPEMKILAKKSRDERISLIEQMFPLVHGEDDLIKVRDRLRICVTQMAFSIPNDPVYSNRLWKVAIASWLLTHEMTSVLDPF